MSFASLLKQTATLEEASVTRSGTGEETNTWAVKTTVPCIVRPASPFANINLPLEEQVTDVLYMEVYTPLLTGRWRAVVDGLTYHVVSVYDPGARGHHYEVSVRQIG